MQLVGCCCDFSWMARMLYLHDKEDDLSTLYITLFGVTIVQKPSAGVIFTANAYKHGKDK